MSLQIISQDHYVPAVFYDSEPHTLTEDKVGTRYMVAGIRTLVDPSNDKDINQVHALQDAIKVDQKDPGKLELPQWDLASQKKVRDALLVLSTTGPDFKKAFGTKQEVDPIRRLIGAAAGWGGNPEKDATYLNITPPKNDGVTVHRLTIKEVPVDAFWSVSLYNGGLLREKPLQRLHHQQSHCSKEQRWNGCDSVRWLRWENFELLANHEGLELHRAPVSSSG